MLSKLILPTLAVMALVLPSATALIPASVDVHVGGDGVQADAQLIAAGASASAGLSGASADVSSPLASAHADASAGLSGLSVDAEASAAGIPAGAHADADASGASASAHAAGTPVGPVSVPPEDLGLWERIKGFLSDLF